MSGTTSLLFVLVLICALVGAVFGVLWLSAREGRRRAEEESLKRFEQARVAEQSVKVLQERLQRGIESLESLRAKSEREQSEARELIEQWSRRYARLAHWEGVEDIRERERELKDSVAVLERAIEALRNVVEGYGSRYVVPPQSIIDELARDLGHSEPGVRLKEARERSRQMIRDRVAATSDFPDPARAQLAADFALDAFNGKAESILSSVKSDNIGTLRQRLKDAFMLVNEQGAAFRNARVLESFLDVKLQELVWAARIQQLKIEEREQQRLLKERMREEAKAQREFEKAQKESQKREEAIAREKALIEEARVRAEREQRALFEARLREELARASESERARIEAELHAAMEIKIQAQRQEYETRLAEQDVKLAEALAARERAKSMAQQTKRGTVYVISNIGAFGDHVFKIGQTRRLDPRERIWELGDASVPFEFDVHALITTDDAPQLEGALHERFVLSQVNKMNWRKEFFRVELGEIRRVVESMGLDAEWTMIAAAQQYRETQALERQFEADPALRERWVQEQRGIEFEPESASVGAEDDE